MTKTGLLNPAVVELLARFRHTNTIVIADRGFPYWPNVPTIDLSLVDDIPTVRQVLAAIAPRYDLGAAYMAEEFLGINPPETARAYEALLSPVRIGFESHVSFKHRVPGAIGLIRTGDTTQFGNILLESA